MSIGSFSFLFSCVMFMKTLERWVVSPVIAYLLAAGTKGLDRNHHALGEAYALRVHFAVVRAFIRLGDILPLTGACRLKK